jgi:hypothetical protein
VSLSGTGESDATLVVAAGQMSVSDLATTPMPSLAQSAPGMASDVRAATRPPRPAPPPVKKTKSRVGLVVGVLALVVAAGGGAAYYLATRGGGASPATGAQQAQSPPQQATATASSPGAQPSAQGTQPPSSATQQTAQGTQPPATEQAGPQTATTQQSATRPEQTQPPPAARPTAPAVPRTGSLLVTDLPSGGSIVIDGGRVIRDETSVDLDPGSHSITLTAPGYEAQRETVRIAAGRTLQLAFRAQRLPPQVTQPAKPPETQPQTARELVAGQGILRLAVAPVAEIIIAGDSRGIQSRLVDTLLAGGYRIRLVPTDRAYADSTFSIEVKPGQNPPVIIQLRRK